MANRYNKNSIFGKNKAKKAPKNRGDFDDDIYHYVPDTFANQSENQEQGLENSENTQEFEDFATGAIDLEEAEDVEKAKRKKNFIFNILIAIFACVFLVSSYLLVDNMFLKGMENQKVVDKLKDQLESNQDEVDPSIIAPEVGVVDDVYTGYTEAVKSLKEKYPDLTGWIRIDNTDIQYPVVKASQENPEYYLYRNYTGEYSKYGTIFHDKHSDINSFNQLLHGHSMNDGSMFYPLIAFGDIDVYKQSPIIYYDTYEEAGIYKIVSIYKTNLYASQGKVFDYFQCDFPTEELEMQYIYDIMNRSMIDTGVDINSNDEFLTLSTCSYEFDEFRTVVVARKVREGEDISVDTTQAVARGDDTLYPDVWYNNKGGNKPKLPETFEEAYEQGLTDWWYVE